MDILGIDIGGSGIKGAVVDTLTGKLKSERHRIPTPASVTPEQIAEIIKQIVDHFSWSGKIGCGFPAVVQSGCVKTASNIDATNIDTNVEELFSQVTGCPVKVVNDADAAGIAEAAFGAGKNANGLVLMLTIGTGIGSSLILNGTVVPNSEFGQLFLRNGLRAEHFASDAVRSRDELKWKVWAKRFNKVVTYIESITNPDLIILGGGISRDFNRYGERLKTKAPVIPAQLLNLAGIVGAALYASKY